VVMQQVEAADLLVDNVDKYEHVDKGVIIYICFLKDATKADIEKIARDVVEASLVFKHATQQSVSVLDCGADIMVIPQASLAGKLKDKKLQFHSLINKQEGLVLYMHFIECVRELIHSISSQDANTFLNGRFPLLVHGTYSNRQGLKFNSSGPCTYQLDG